MQDSKFIFTLRCKNATTSSNVGPCCPGLANILKKGISFEVQGSDDGKKSFGAFFGSGEINKQQSWLQSIDRKKDRNNESGTNIYSPEDGM